MMKLNRLAAAVVLGVAMGMGPAAAAGQDLPPDIQVDLYLVRADRHIESQDWVAALEAMDVVFALQAAHGLETAAALWFKHAQVALDAGYPQTAVTSVTRYLREAGRQGDQYVPALALLDEAQSRAAGEAVSAPAPTAPAPTAPAPTAPAPTAPAPAPAPTAPAVVDAAEPSEAVGGLKVLFPLIGMNAATMAFTSSESLAVDASYMNGLAGGLAVAFPVRGDALGVQVGAQFAHKGARIAAQDSEGATFNTDFSFQSVDFTVLARVSPPQMADLPFYLLIGPYASMEVDCRVALDAALDTGAGTERFTVNDDCSNADLDTQSIDFGLSGGVGAEIGTGTTRLTIGLLYNYGLQDINKYAGKTARHRVLNIHAGVATTF